MNNKDVEIIREEILFSGFFQMKRYTLKHRLFNGSWSETLSREVLERRPITAVIPYDPILDTVVLIEQFRPGPMANQKGSPWMIEIVAGILDYNETPNELACRETVEETGGNLSELMPICNFYTTPGSSCEYCHLLCGKINSSGMGGLFGNPEEGEDIRVLVEPATEAFDRISSGKIGSSFSIIALQWLLINRDSLRAQWT